MFISAIGRESEVAQSCPTLCDPVNCSLCPWDSSGKNTGMGCHFLLQWGWRNTAKKYHWHVWECSQGLGHTGFAPAHSSCAFQIYTAQAPECSSGELSKVGPGLHALPRPKLLRFRFLGTPQRHRLSWVCVLCHS